MADASTADALHELGVDPAGLPRHIAIIMDGNGRWARHRGLPRVEGHRRGAHVVDEIVTHCTTLGIECVTLFSFSSENWKRPKAEVDALMALCAEYLVAQRERIRANRIRVRQVGRREGLPVEVLRELDITAALVREPRLTLCLALNYGARGEIVDAVQALARRVQQGELRPDEIGEQQIAAHLYTAGLPDPDLVIRTAGEMRLSNFLLWQVSYAELYVSPVLWPDFGVPELNQALRSYAARERRFGDVGPNKPA
jgi:undecaprenyl diphosphate synthase